MSVFGQGPCRKTGRSSGNKKTSIFQGLGLGTEVGATTHDAKNCGSSMDCELISFHIHLMAEVTVL